MDGPSLQRGIGVVAPFDFALDRELWRWMPRDVSLHLTRTRFVADPVSVELAEKISDPTVVRRAVRDIAAVEPLVHAYACTSGSFVAGVAGERRLVQTMLRAGAPCAVTTSGALLEALEALEVERVLVVTPYVEGVTARLRRFLAEAGVQAVASAQLGLHHNIWKVSYRDTAALVREADCPQAQAVFVACTNLPTYDIIAPLEAELGKPVLTANQVTMWAALRRLPSGRASSGGASSGRARQALMRTRSTRATTAAASTSKNGSNSNRGAP